MKELMTPKHPRWEEFMDRLYGPECCDWTRKGWRCHGDLRFATAILKEMAGVDVAASLESFRDRGGYCDCEILMNCDEPEVWREE